MGKYMTGTSGHQLWYIMGHDFFIVAYNMSSLGRVLFLLKAHTLVQCSYVKRTNAITV